MKCFFLTLTVLFDREGIFKTQTHQLRHGGGACLLPLLVHRVSQLRGTGADRLPTQHGAGIITIVIISITIIIMNIEQVPLGEMVILALTELLTSSAQVVTVTIITIILITIVTTTLVIIVSVQNAGVFRELGGAGLAGKLVKHADTRDAGLGLLQQLVVAGGLCIFFILMFHCFLCRWQW